MSLIILKLDKEWVVILQNGVGFNSTRIDTSYNLMHIQRPLVMTQSMNYLNTINIRWTKLYCCYINIYWL